MTAAIDPLVLAYLAGFVDADGYIVLRRGRGKTKTYYSPRIGMSGARREPMDLAAQVFGGNVHFYPARSPEYQGVFVWERSGKLAVEIIQQLAPFLRVKAEHASMIRWWVEERQLEDDLGDWVGMLAVTGDYDPDRARDAGFGDIAYLQLRRRRPAETEAGS